MRSLRLLPLLLLAVLALVSVQPAEGAKRCSGGKVRAGGKCVKKCPKGKVKKRGKCVKRAVKPAVPAPAGGAFSGESEQSRTMSFTVSGGQVVDFVAGVNTWCNTVGNQRFQFDAIANVPPLPIAADGTFSWEGESEDGNAEITGRITGGTATGTVGMFRGDSNYSVSDGLVFGSCSASDVAWTATAG